MKHLYGGKRKYAKGRIPRCNPRYIFGIINKEEHKVFLQFVTKRDQRHILPIIQNKIGDGCQINSDGANVYKILSRLGRNYQHRTVIHECEFVNPTDGTHTNWIEIFFSNMKAKLKVIRGSQRRMLDGHLDEFVYRTIEKMRVQFSNCFCTTSVISTPFNWVEIFLLIVLSN